MYMSLYDKIYFNKTLNSIDFDLSKCKFGFVKCKSLISKISNEDIKGLPFICSDSNNNVFTVKIFPVEKTYENNNSLIEINYLHLFTSELLNTYISPNFPYMYKSILNIPNNSDCLSHIPYKKLQKINLIEPYSHVLFSEYFIEKDIDNWFYNNKINDYHFKSIIFQVCITLSILQDKYKFIHNDLHPGNVLIDKIKKDNDIVYNFDKLFFSLPNTGFIVKLWDFEFSNIYNEEYKLYKNPIVFDTGYNEFSDIHTFLKGLLELNLPRITRSFIESLYPVELLYSNSKSKIIEQNDTQFLKCGRLNSTALQTFSLPSPKSLLTHKYFKYYLSSGKNSSSYFFSYQTSNKMRKKDI